MTSKFFHFFAIHLFAISLRLRRSMFNVRCSMFAVSCLTLAFGLPTLDLHADSPNYRTFSSVAGTSSSSLLIPADPQLSIRIVSLVCSSDKAGSVAQLTAGTNAYAIAVGQVAGTTITVNQTNGLRAADLVFISKADGSTNFATSISSISNTNLVLAVASFITTNNPPDSVYKMVSTNTIPIGAASNVTQNGEAIYTAPQGRPIRIIVDGTSWSQVDRCVVRYE